MKKGIVVTLMLALSCFNYGQPVEKTAPPTVGQEFRKAGTQKRVGIAPLAAGSTLALVPLSLPEPPGGAVGKPVVDPPSHQQRVCAMS